MSTENSSLQVVDLESIRDDRTLFSKLNFELAAGQVVQIEGANGSGKTTLLRMICGMLLPISGEVRWNGKNILKDRSEYYEEMTYLGHGQGVKGDFTPLENLNFEKSLVKTSDRYTPEEILQKVGLAGFEDIPSRTLSAGQRRRITLGRLLLTDATLWILDEPFTSLDKQGQTLVEDLLIEHADNGGMVLITSHQRVNVHDGKSRVVSLNQ